MTEDAARALLRAILQDEQAAHWHDDIRVVLADVPRETSPVLAENFPPPGLEMDAWAEWCKYRTERRLPKYRVTATMKLARWLAAKPAAEQRAIIDQSIRNNWQGLFEQKGSSNGQGAGSRYDRLGREFESKAAGVLSLESPAPDVRQSLPRPVRHRAE